MVSRVITDYNNVFSPVFTLYSSSFVGTLKNEIPGAALELCQLKIKQFLPDILKFSTKHEDNPFTLNSFMVPRIFCLYFMQAYVDWVLIMFGTQVMRKKRPVWPVFPDYLSVSYDYKLTEGLLYIGVYGLKFISSSASVSVFFPKITFPCPNSFMIVDF